MSASGVPTIVQLHVAHDLGGGTATWLGHFVAADRGRRNLVFKSITHGYESASSVALFDADDLDNPLKVWPFTRPIPAAVVSHAEYKAALDEAIGSGHVDAVIVSSLIGHSLEALETGLPTLVVNHDYFPYCPAIHLFFGNPCTHCGSPRLRECAHGNTKTSAFRDFPPEVREAVRERFVEAVLRPNVTMVAPSASVRRNLERLDARFLGARFAVVPHGLARSLPVMAPIRRENGDRLRILVLGQVSFVKGAELLHAALPRITRFADVFLLGAGELGRSFEGMPHVDVVLRYEPGELAGHIRAINPHLGLLTSIVPETFSFTLSELLAMGIPVAASRIGSFEDRIRPGVNGFLFDPDASSLVALVESIDADPGALDAMRASFRPERRTADEMVADYHALLPIAPRRAQEPRPRVREATAIEDLMGRQALHLADLWKELKSLHVQLTLANQIREKERAAAAAEAQRLRHQLLAADRRVADVSRAAAEKQRENEALRRETQQQADQLRRIFSSRSWRILGIGRRAARGAGKLGLLARCLFGMARDPRGPVAGMRHVFRSWRAAGVLGLKSSLLSYESRQGTGPAWREYRAALVRDILPILRTRIASMKVRPRISILMAAYETAPGMLRAALDSVIAQIYPDWELCLVDDGSKAAHVGAILREYAARDPRIKVETSRENGGVARASNRALARATGEYVVLMDHDDILEEQALFRVAEAFGEDGADLVYSDEVLVGPDGEHAMEFVYRPAFSPELLRSHPYIVHLVGLRTDLVRRVGGFDESLHISQDYDLILRCTEQASRVVHIPEILYRWRTHALSAGHRMMGKVMETSAQILERHLARSGTPGAVRPGFGFNFFDSRYALEPGSRIAIIIPTRNQGDLLRACVESLHATIKEVRFDVIVVDHESDDPATRRYLETSRQVSRVLRYEGPFNFSAINNRAISEIGQGYSHYLFCNNDIEAIREGWLERMVALAQQPGVGIVGAKLLYSDAMTIQHAGVGVGLFVRAEHYGKFVQVPEGQVVPGYYGTFHVTREVSAVTAACMLARREAIDRVGGFDESFAVGFGDVDLCLRVLAAGYRVLNCAAAALIHHESATRGPNDRHPADSALFERKWAALLAAGDPYYNPGFSTTSTTWQTKRPLHRSVDVVRRIVDLDRAAGRQEVRVGTTLV